MGYSTDFTGSFGLNEPLSTAHLNYLTKFSQTRRMNRDEKIAENFRDTVRESVNLPVGPDGAYYVGASDDFGQCNDSSIRSYNSPPTGQPGLWCQWIPLGNEDIGWDGGEKFYNYIEWLEYIIKHFLAPWGYVLNGTVAWQGEDSDDFGKIVVKNNVVTIKRGKKVYD
jgi:hypothetical protein